MRADIRVYGILDPAATPCADLPMLARLAVRGGVTLLQYRDKSADGRLFVERARSILAALAGTSVPLLINDRIDVAIAVGAQGVHLGQDDILPRDAREMLGPTKIIGRTLNNEADVREMVHEPVDYGCVSGVFPTLHKNYPDPPMGIAGLARLALLSREIAPDIPVGAIAGITEVNAPQVIAAGADGVAVIGAIFNQLDPAGAARRLRDVVEEALSLRSREKGLGAPLPIV
jgi:thiamine-phosphate pyrophosphorylase